jgi:serine/threonine protein kinase
MDPSVRKAAQEERRILQALYDKEEEIGKGAFGVVVKAFLKQPAAAPATAAQKQQQAEQKQQVAAAAGGDAASSSSSSTSAAPSRSYVAIKQMLNQREGQGIPQDAYREIKLLKEFRGQHENIVRLERVFTRPGQHEIDLVYEYAECDLSHFIKENRSRAQAHAHATQRHFNQSLADIVDERWVKSCMYQILSGLSFLHRNWVMHRDMKPQNILITAPTGPDGSSEEGGRIKIGK